MKVALIVPAYKPTADMIPMLERFSRETDFVPVVVDDGSGEDFREVFAKVPEGTHLLRHEVNKGKGAAMKTAMRYILDKLPECTLAVTADADGQHRYGDIVKVVQKAEKRHGALVLGSRAFDGKIPLRSRVGNAITRQVFAAASGTPVRDTQTGLRAFDREAMRKFIDIPGDRYEYEINMLLYAAQNEIPIIEETIETVYIDDNSSSHFNPLRDSLKIYMCIFKYIASSLIGFGVDFVALLLFKWLTAGLGAETSLLVSVVLARIVSAVVNFAINKTVVFKSKGDWKAELGKYAALAVIVLIANYYLLRLFTITLNWPLVPSKLLVEVVLFCANFLIQGRFVYGKKKNV